MPRPRRPEEPDVGPQVRFCGSWGRVTSPGYPTCAWHGRKTGGASPLGTLTEGTPHRRDRGAGPEHRPMVLATVPRGAEGEAIPRGSVRWKSKVQCRTERKRSAVRRVSSGEPAVSGEARYPLGGHA